MQRRWEQINTCSELRLYEEDSGDDGNEDGSHGRWWGEAFLRQKITNEMEAFGELDLESTIWVLFSSV